MKISNSSSVAVKPNPWQTVMISSLLQGYLTLPTLIAPANYFLLIMILLISPFYSLTVNLYLDYLVMLSFLSYVCPSDKYFFKRQA